MNFKNKSIPMLTVIVPCFNEEKSLPDIIPTLSEKCENMGWKLIFINDGSTDNSLNILRKLNNHFSYKIINHKLNQGYGAAIITGIKNVETEYLITFDADGQHDINDIEKLYNIIIEKDADMVIGSRKNNKIDPFFRKVGKIVIKCFAKLTMKTNIYDLNSGMKIYKSDLAKKYISICPDSMAFSDIITLIFLSKKHLVLEIPINIKLRKTGRSTINLITAFITVYEILNIIMLFNPMKLFIPLSVFIFITTMIWAIPFIVQGKGVTTGTLLGFLVSLIFFFLGLIAEQLSQLRKDKIK